MYPGEIAPYHGRAVELVVQSLYKHPQINEQTVLRINNLYKEGEYKSEGIRIYHRAPNQLHKLTQNKHTAVEHLVADLSPDFIHFHNLYPGIFYLKKLLQKQLIPYGISFRASDLRVLRLSWQTKSLATLIEQARFRHHISYHFYYLMKKLSTYNQALDNAVFIPNAVPDSFYHDAQPNNDDTLPFLAIAGIEQRKNLPLLIEAISSLEGAPQLNIYGPIYNKSEFKKLQLTPNTVAYQGTVPHNQLPHVIDQHLAMTLVAKAETFGMAYAESLARCRPILAPLHAGIWGYLDAKTCGVQVVDSSVKAIKEGIRVLKRDFCDFSFQGSERFKLSLINKEWLQLYHHVLN